MSEPELPNAEQTEGEGSEPVEAPNDPAALLESAEAAYKDGLMEEAEALCLRVAELDPSSAKAKAIRSDVAFATNRPELGIQLLRDILHENPDSYGVLRALAMRLAAAGQYDQAVVYGQRILDLRPDDIGAIDHLGKMHAALGNHEEAQICFEKAIALDSKVASFHHNLGIAYTNQGKNSEAAGAFEKAIEIAPDHAPALIALGHITRNRGSRSESAKIFRRAHEIERDTPRGWKSLAKAQVDENDFEGAVESLKQAVELQPEDPDARLRLASIYRLLGRHDEARLQFERVIELNPRDIGPYAAVALDNPMTEADRPMIDRLAVMARSQSLRPPERRLSRFALGKALDELGDYKDAMVHFDEANGIAFHLRHEKKPDLEARDSAMNRAMRSFTKEALQENPGTGSTRPIILVGFPQAALLEQILASHPEVGIAGDMPFWRDNVKEVYSGPKRSISPGRVLSLGREFDRLLEDKEQGKRFVTVALHESYWHLGQLHLAFPQAAIIDFRRHPVDSCLAMYMSTQQHPIDLAYNRPGIVFACREYETFMNHWREVIPSDRIHSMSYENLAADPKKATRAMLDFIGLEGCDECLTGAQSLIFRTLRKDYEPWLGEFAELATEEVR
jgi:tetratricopeptide (TPR) repeat protein